VSIQVFPSHGEAFEVRGRGELQLSILIENLRREKFELSIAPPKVVFKEEKGKILEPMEEVTIDVPNAMSNNVLEKLTRRKAELKDMTQTQDGRAKMIFEMPTRGLIGYGSEFTADTRGSGILNHIFLNYVSHLGPIQKLLKGALISMETGKTTAYALEALEPRGTLFVHPGAEVYPGMVIGEHSREDDLHVNPVKAKALTNIRAASKDDKIRLSPPHIMTLENAIAYVRDDEMIEVTPACIRLRKQNLNQQTKGKKK